MKVLLTATTLLGLGISAAQPTTSAWPQGSCLHGTTINESGRPLNLRALESHIRYLLQQAKVSPAAVCSSYLNILVQAESISQQNTRITAHLILAEREVSLTDFKRNDAAFKCSRTVTQVVHHDEDFFASAQDVLTRVFARAPHCTR